MGLCHILSVILNESHHLHLCRVVDLQTGPQIKIIASERNRLVLFVRNVICELDGGITSVTLYYDSSVNN